MLDDVFKEFREAFEAAFGAGRVRIQHNTARNILPPWVPRPKEWGRIEVFDWMENDPWCLQWIGERALKKQ